jgi:hypothetical protein
VRPAPVRLIRQHVAGPRQPLKICRLLDFDPGFGLGAQFGHRKQVVFVQAVCILPGFVAISV